MQFFQKKVKKNMKKTIFMMHKTKEKKLYFEIKNNKRNERKLKLI